MGASGADAFSLEQDTQSFAGFMIATMDSAEANVPLIGELLHGLFLAGELPDDLLHLRLEDGEGLIEAFREGSAHDLRRTATAQAIEEVFGGALWRDKGLIGDFVGLGLALEVFGALVLLVVGAVNGF